MTTVLGLVGYQLTGLPARVISSVPIEASIRRNVFGSLEGQPEAFSREPVESLFQQWLSNNLQEPSWLIDGQVTVVEAPVATTDLVTTDHSLAQAAAGVALIRALAEQVPLQDLPPLEHLVVVGALQADGSLFCPQTVSSKDIRRALDGSRAQALVGPFVSTDPEFRDIQVTPVQTFSDLLRFALGDNPVRVLRLVCEWLILCSPAIQGTEAELWHEAERRAAENLSALSTWFQEIGRRPPRSQTIIKAALSALAALAKFQTGDDRSAPTQTIVQLERNGYPLTAVWLLTRWSFLLRERRHEEEAERCLARAAAIQDRLPLRQAAPLLPHQIGRSLYYQGRFAEALEKYWHGYRLLGHAAGAEDQLADFYNSAGKCFNDTYQFALALELFERARTIRTTHRQDEKLARTYGAMGESYWRLGKLEDAQHCYQESLKLFRTVDRARNEQREEMRSSNYLAHILFAKGELGEARKLYEKTETYYWDRYEAGATHELSNLVYSIEGVVRVAAAQGRWDEVEQSVADTFAGASGALGPSASEVLPVALLGYVDALRLRHSGDAGARRSRLVEVERLLSGLYPVERAMVMIEQAIGEIEAGGSLEAQVFIEPAHRILATFFAIAEQPMVVQTFIPIRRAVADGSEALGQEGKELIAADGQRWKTLEGYFASALRHGEVRQADMVIGNLRKVQESVVFFRDILRWIRVE